MPRTTNILRRRDVAHMWADKRVLRLFRRTFNNDTCEYKKFREVYTALCEIDSDFHENPDALHSLLSTVSTYAGVSRNTVSKVMQELKRVDLISYGQNFDEVGNFSNSYMHLYMFDEGKTYDLRRVGVCTTLRPREVATTQSSDLVKNSRASKSFKKKITNITPDGVDMYKDLDIVLDAQRVSRTRPSGRQAPTSRADMKARAGKATVAHAEEICRQYSNEVYNLVDYFRTQYKEKFGKSPARLKSQHFKLMKDHLKEMSASDTRKLIDHCLSSPDMQWLRDNNCTISGILSDNTIHKFNIHNNGSSDRFNSHGGLSGNSNEFANVRGVRI